LFIRTATDAFVGLVGAICADPHSLPLVATVSV
jgi:hypothetical protein